MRHVLLLAASLVLAPGSAAEAPESAACGDERPAVSAEPPSLPASVADAEWRPLSDSVDRELQAALERRLEGNREWAELIRKKRLAVGLVDLRKVEAPRFARVNGNLMTYAASLPKIAVLLAAVQAFEDGRLEETPEILSDLADMIRVSDNASATRVMDLLGYDYIEKVLTDPRYRLFDRKRGGGLWVGKRYAKSGPRKGDPLHDISHGATATQTCRFYYLLATGRLVSPERSRQMLGMLADPGLSHKFVRSLERRAPRARLFRKSGTWRIWHSDSVLVWGPERRYILVALAEHAEGGRIMEELVAAVEDVLMPRTGTPPP